MARYERFTFLVNRDERRALAELAERLGVSQSDVVRLGIRQVAAEGVPAADGLTAIKAQPEEAQLERATA